MSLLPRAQVCVDVFVMSQSYADVATLKELCATTAGSLFHYQPFDAAADAEHFWNDFRWSIVRPQARIWVQSSILNSKT